MKAQVSLEALLVIAAITSVILLCLPVFFTLKEANDRSFEALHLKNVANQLLYYCNKNAFTDFDFEIDLFKNMEWSANSGILALSSENFQEEIDFQCNSAENLQAGKYNFHAEKGNFQKIN